RPRRQRGGSLEACPVLIAPGPCGLAAEERGQRLQPQSVVRRRLQNPQQERLELLLDGQFRDHLRPVRQLRPRLSQRPRQAESRDDDLADLGLEPGIRLLKFRQRRPQRAEEPLDLVLVRRPPGPEGPRPAGGWEVREQELVRLPRLLQYP